MVASDEDFAFASRNERFKQIEIKTIMEKELLATFQHK